MRDIRNDARRALNARPSANPQLIAKNRLATPGDLGANFPDPPKGAMVSRGFLDWMIELMTQARPFLAWLDRNVLRALGRHPIPPRAQKPRAKPLQRRSRASGIVVRSLS